MIRQLIAGAWGLLVSLNAFPQYTHTLKFPEDSPFVEETQRLGVTDISVSYSSPAVRGREIWGKIVPYGSDIPWRGGANINTKISFSTDVNVNNNALPAGSYGLHFIPNPSGEWTVIFSANDNVWGSYYYKKEEDALRMQVLTQPCDFRDRLSYEFRDRTDSSIVIALEWERLRVPIKIEVDVVQTTLEGLRADLRGINANSWYTWHRAAEFCLEYNTNLEEALLWAERSIQGGYGGYAGLESFQTYFTKFKVLKKLGRDAEAELSLQRGVTLLREEDDYITYAFYLIANKKPAEGLKLLEDNLKKRPTSASAWMAAATAYERTGDLARSVSYSKKGLEFTPAEYKAITGDVVKRREEKLSKSSKK